MNNDKISIPYSLLAILLLACDILPFIQVQFNLTQLALMNFAFLTFFVFPKQTDNIIVKYSLRLIPFILISYFVTRACSFKYGVLHPYLLFFIMMSPALITCDLIRRDSKKEIYIIFFSLCVMLLFVLIQSFIEILINPAILREMTATSVTDEEYLLEMKMKGVGGFGIAYGTGILLLSIFTHLKYVKRKLWKAVLISFMVFLLIFIINANFTTLLLITIFCTFFYMYMRNHSTSYRIALLTILCLLLFVTPAVLKYAIAFYDGTATAYHLNDILNSISGNGTIVSERSSYSAQLWSGIIDSPLWGRDITTPQAALLYANSHSTILGHMYATGIIGVISYFSALWIVVRNILGKVLIPKESFVVLIIYYFLLAYFDPSESIEVSVCIFMFYPLLSTIIKNKYGFETLAK